MDMSLVANGVSFLVAIYAAYQGMQSKATGKTKTAIQFIVWGIVVLGALEFLALVGWNPPQDSFWRPLFWDLDILTTIFLFFAIRELKGK